MDISSIAMHIGAPVEAAAPRPVAADQRVLIQAVKAVNAAELFSRENELTLGLAPNTRKPVVRLVNRETREVIEQMPTEDVLRLAEEISSAQTNP